MKPRILIENGLVSSSVVEQDHRWQILSLTEAGQKVYETALPVMHRRQKHLQEGLSEDDIETFRRVMATLEKAAEATEI